MKSSFCLRLGKSGQALKILHLCITNAFQDCSDLNCPFETQELFPRLSQAPDGSLTSLHTEVEEMQRILVFPVHSLLVFQNVKDWYLMEYKQEANVIRDRTEGIPRTRPKCQLKRQGKWNAWCL